METKEKMEKQVRRGDIYYQLAKRGSLRIDHPAMVTLQKFADKANKILDLGCGEGTRLSLLAGNKSGRAVGVDISNKAIDLAKKSYPKIKFIKADLEKIPLDEGSFDLVYSAYVLEHLTSPTKVVLEAIRLIEQGGFLILVAPNYGAPNRCSPPFKGSRIKKTAKGLIEDLLNPLEEINSLHWNRVNPIADKDRDDVDWDTVVEPYIGTLIKFLKKNNLQIIEFNSCWSEELKDAKLHQQIFRFLGERGIYPFFLWGPHLLIVAKKRMNYEN